jgi:hypothetical protein
MSTQAHEQKQRFPNEVVELVRVKADYPGAYRLKDIPVFFKEKARNPYIEDTQTGQRTPVPFGNLENYARHLAGEWGSDQEYVVLVVSETVSGNQLPTNPDELEEAFDQHLQMLPGAERERLQSSLSRTSNSIRLDDAKPDTAEPNAC